MHCLLAMTQAHCDSAVCSGLGSAALPRRPSPSSRAVGTQALLSGPKESWAPKALLDTEDSTVGVGVR